MVKKITGQKDAAGHGGKRKQLQSKRLKLKSLHKHVAQDSNELRGLPAEELPPASSSNAARQARARLNITFPVNWQDLHLREASERKRVRDRKDSDEKQED